MSEPLPAARPPVEAPATREATVEVTDGARLPFQIAAEGTTPPVFALGIRKSGSTMLHKIVGFLARRAGVTVVDIPGTFFRAGYSVADWTRADLSPLLGPGNCYLGFRSFPSNLVEHRAFLDAPKVFMFRDPRDALVSQYFSDAYSHSLPSRETETGARAAEAFERKRAEALASDIEDYVIRQARALDNTLLAYAPMLEDPTCLPLRYEEYVFTKKRLVHKVLNHFGWSAMPGQIENLLRQVDEVPETEDRTRFVRRVIPGDHRAKLAPETVRRLNNIMRESMRLYDYY